MKVPSLSSGCEIYPSQTKILDGLTKDEIQMFDIPFKGVSTRFGLRTIAKYIEKSGFHLLSILPKSSFGEHKIAQFFVRYMESDAVFIMGLPC
jgi:hypothetical protein